MENILWTEKYIPKNINEIVGNSVTIEKIQNWLRSW